MLTAALCTAFYSDDDLPKWLAALNWLYLGENIAPWEVLPGQAEPLTDLLGQPIPPHTPYYRRQLFTDLDPILLSADSLKIFLFLLYFDNLGLERFTREDLPRTAAAWDRSVKEGTYRPLNLHHITVPSPEESILSRLAGATPAFKYMIRDLIDILRQTWPADQTAPPCPPSPPSNS